MGCCDQHHEREGSTRDRGSACEHLGDRPAGQRAKSAADHEGGEYRPVDKARQGVAGAGRSTEQHYRPSHSNSWS